MHYEPLLLLNLLCRAPPFSDFTSYTSKRFLPSTLRFYGARYTKNCSVRLSSFKDDALVERLSTSLSQTVNDDIAYENGDSENDELGLLNKPSLLSVSNAATIEESDGSKKPEKNEILKPFLKFLKPRDYEAGAKEELNASFPEAKCVPNDDEGGSAKVNIDYYDPKPGDFVVGVVVSGNENKLDVNVGASMLGTMLTKEVMPLYDKELNNLLCDMEKDGSDFLVRGRMGIMNNEMALHEVPGPGKPLIETGTVLFAEVLGSTLSGRPLLSTRRLFRRIAWHRVRQLKEMKEPFEVCITEWNTGGLLARIEGLRAFLPKAELLNRANNFNELKQNVGRRMCVLINRINEANNDLILSEREAWEITNLQDGSLLDGTVRKIFPYGAQIRIGDTNRSGLLHITNISQSRVTSVQDVLKIDDRVKVLVVKSMFPDKISLSIANLEREPGLFLSDRERVFSEAQEMAKIYRKNLPPAASEMPAEITCALPFDDEAAMYANWKWFKFERGDDDDVTPMRTLTQRF